MSHGNTSRSKRVLGPRFCISWSCDVYRKKVKYQHLLAPWVVLMALSGRFLLKSTKFP